MSQTPNSNTRTSHRKLIRNAALAVAAFAAAAYFIGAGEEDAPIEDVMQKAVNIVAANQKKPCAAEAAKISALLLSDPGLTCNGPHVVQP